MKTLTSSTPAISETTSIALSLNPAPVAPRPLGAEDSWTRQSGTYPGPAVRGLPEPGFSSLSSSEGNRPLPVDLTDWFPATTLEAWCADAAREVYWTGPGAESAEDAQVLRLLASITHCYAARMFSTRGSESVAAGIVACRKAGQLARRDDATLISDSAPPNADPGGKMPPSKAGEDACRYGDAARLRLFRAHYSELIKLCLARVFARAWTARFGELDASTNPFAARRYQRALQGRFADEAARRVRAASRTDAAGLIGSIQLREGETPSSPDIRHRQGSTAASPCRVGWRPSVSVWLGLVRMVRATFCVWSIGFVALTSALAAEKWPVVTVDEQTYTNAVVIESNPIDIVIKADGPVFARIKRQDLPDQLRERYPYDADEAERYAQEKRAKAKAQQEVQRADAHGALLRREAELQAKIHAVDKRLNALQKELDVVNVSARGKPRSAARQEADRMRTTKQNLIRYQEQLRDLLEQVRNALANWR